MMTLHNVLSETTEAGVKNETENYSKSRQYYYQNVPFNLIKKRNTRSHFVVLSPLMRKLLVFVLSKIKGLNQFPINFDLAVFRGLRTTKAQTSLRIRTVWSSSLLFSYWKVSYQNLPQAKFL